MTRTVRCIQRFLADEEGATVAEYAVLLALILLAIVTMVSEFGGSTATWWHHDADTISSAMNGAGS